MLSRKSLNIFLLALVSLSLLTACASLSSEFKEPSIGEGDVYMPGTLVPELPERPELFNLPRTDEPGMYNFPQQLPETYLESRREASVEENIVLPPQ